MRFLPLHTLHKISEDSKNCETDTPNDQPPRFQNKLREFHSPVFFGEYGKIQQNNNPCTQKHSAKNIGIHLKCLHQITFQQVVYAACAAARRALKSILQIDAWGDLSFDHPPCQHSACQYKKQNKTIQHKYVPPFYHKPLHTNNKSNCRSNCFYYVLFCQ